MTDSLRVGIIGVGTIGRKHIEAFTNNRNANVEAIADNNKTVLESAKNEFNVENAFLDYRELLSLDSLEAVVVCTPPFNHAVITCDAASKGKHVLCEKPMAMNAIEAKAMLEACDMSGVRLGVCSARLRFDPAIEYAKDYISQGKLGDIYYIRTTTLRRRGRPGIDILKESKWFLNSSKAGGGALMDIGCYDIDVLLYLLEDVQPKSVNAITYKGIGKQKDNEIVYDVEEHASVFVRFEKNQTATVETSWASNIGSYMEALIFGSEGGLKLYPLTIYTEEDDREIATTIDFKRKSWDTWKWLIMDFISACHENHRPKTSGEDGLKAMQIIEMAYKSATLGKEVTVESINS